MQNQYQWMEISVRWAILPPEAPGENESSLFWFLVTAALLGFGLCHSSLQGQDIQISVFSIFTCECVLEELCV